MKQVYLVVTFLIGSFWGLQGQNVGVNNTNPGAALDVKGAAGGGPLLNVRDENDATRMHILSNGNVGIGTASPGSHKLNVQGSTYVLGSIRVSQDNTTGGGIILADDGDIVDLNDGFATMRFSYGVRLTDTNAGGSVTSQISGNSANNTFFNASNNVGIGNAAPSSKLHVTGDLKVANDGWSYMDDTTSGGWNGLYFRSAANALTEGGFILKQDESANSLGTSGEDVRFSIGVYNDFRQSSAHSDELWFQGGGRLVYNVGSWDSELNTIIGTPGVGTTGGHEWRVNNGTKMTLNHNGDLSLNNLAGTGRRPLYVDNNGTITKGTGSDNSLWTIAMDMASSPDDLGGSDLSFTSDDDGYNHYTMPFNYTIEGTNYNTLTICTNGWIAFGSITNTNNNGTTLPASFTSNPVIFPYWTDLRDYGSGENVRAYSFGSSPNRVVIVHYKMKAYCGGSAPGSGWFLEFQVMIHENGGINVKYINMPPAMNGQATTCSGTFNTTIGFQLSGGSSAKAFPISYNAKVLDDNRMPESWSVSPVK